MCSSDLTCIHQIRSCMAYIHTCIYHPISHIHHVPHVIHASYTFGHAWHTYIHAFHISFHMHIMLHMSSMHIYTFGHAFHMHTYMLSHPNQHVLHTYTSTTYQIYIHHCISSISITISMQIYHFCSLTSTNLTWL